jgi:hypothetical protein
LSRRTSEPARADLGIVRVRTAGFNFGDGLSASLH